MLIFTSKLLWEKYQTKLIAESEYLVGDGDLNISDPPEWFANMLNDEAGNFKSKNHSLLDTELVPNTQQYFGSIPWVRNVKRIEKNAKWVEC